MSNNIRESLHTVAPWQVMEIYYVNEMREFLSLFSILQRWHDLYVPSHTVVSKHSHHPTPWLTPALSSAVK